MICMSFPTCLKNFMLYLFLSTILIISILIFNSYLLSLLLVFLLLFLLLYIKLLIGGNSN